MTKTYIRSSIVKHIEHSANALTKEKFLIKDLKAFKEARNDWSKNTEKPFPWDSIEYRDGNQTLSIIDSNHQNSITAQEAVDHPNKDKKMEEHFHNLICNNLYYKIHDNVNGNLYLSKLIENVNKEVEKRILYSKEVKTKFETKFGEKGTTEKIKSLEDEIGALETQLKERKGEEKELVSLNTKLDTLNKELKTLNTKLETLNEELSLLRKKIEEKNESIKNIKKEITQLSTEIEIEKVLRKNKQKKSINTFNNKIKSKQALVKKTNTINLSDNKEAVEKAKQEQAEKQEKEKSITEDLEILAKEKKSRNNKIKKLKKPLNAKKQECITLEQDIQNKLNNINITKKEIENLKEKFSQLTKSQITEEINKKTQQKFHLLKIQEYYDKTTKSSIEDIKNNILLHLLLATLEQEGFQEQTKRNKILCSIFVPIIAAAIIWYTMQDPSSTSIGVMVSLELLLLAIFVQTLFFKQKMGRTELPISLFFKHTDKKSENLSYYAFDSIIETGQKPIYLNYLETLDSMLEAFNREAAIKPALN